MRQVYVSNNGEIYALMIDDRLSCFGCISLRSSLVIEGSEHDEIQHSPRCGKSHLSSVMRYKPEANSWQKISPFDLGSKDGISFVANEKFIYLIGGFIRGAKKILTDVDRFDFAENSWSKIADMQEPRHCAYGAALHGKVYITDNGGYDLENFTFKRTCEAYNEAKDEWHFIANLSIPRSRHGSMLCVDEKICVLDDYFNSMSHVGIKIHRYDPDKDKWKEQTDNKIPVKRGYSVGPISHYSLNTCATSVFQPGRRLASDSFTTSLDRCKCLVM
ncbi:kelch-like ECH-associated protein 1 [Stylophora pistillata]|uniref:kelch-like ECH-associated protein 1 n=1 Tax=Stylophora pistillata TaxID=50429 RepID=UPI000C04B798|nr:kelch-like ECH-associated protein 1 [Stylophora pistillata]